MDKRRRDLRAQIEALPRIPVTGCWLWDRAVNAKGYGITRGGLAHRRSYELFVGAIPDGLNVCHVCDVRCCVNPAHLWVGTQRQNVDDAKRKGRMRGCLVGERAGAKHPLAKLTPSDVGLIRHLAGRKTAKEMAQLYGVSREQIGKIIRGERWKVAA